MKLFEIVNNQPCVSAETLLIPEFKRLWDRDKTKTKTKCNKEFAYVYYATDYMSIYLSYTKDIREERLCEDFMEDKTYKPDQMVLDAMKKYDDLQQTPTMNFLKAARSAMQSTEEYFLNIDYTERDMKGAPVYKIKEITSSLKDCSGIKDTMDKLIEAVKKEKSNGTIARGGGIGGEFEFEED